MLIATVLGILTGLFFGERCSIFASSASAYIMILKVTAVPYLICAIIHGIGQLLSSQAKMILKKGIIFILSFWVINILIACIASTLFPESKGSNLIPFFNSSTSPLNLAELLIPANIFYNLSNNIVPPIVIFSVAIGIALMQIKDKLSMMQVLETLLGVLTKITIWISRITPIGTFLIITNKVGTIQFSEMQQVSSYIILYCASILLVVFWICPKIISTLTAIPAIRWIRELLPGLILAYTTSMVIVCLPYIIEVVRRETEHFFPKDEKLQNQVQGVVSIIFNLPLGSLFLGLFLLFIGHYYGLHLTIFQQAESFLSLALVSLGAVGVGAWVNNLTFILDVLDLPLDAINLYLIALPFTSGFQSMASFMEISVISLLITFSCRDLLFFRLKKVLKSIALIIAPLAFAFIFLIRWNPFPIIERTTKSIYDLPLDKPLIESSLANAGTQPNDLFGRMLGSGVIRIGTTFSTPPFTFVNHLEQPAGFDIEMAYELAQNLGLEVQIEQMDARELENALQDGKIDIAMSAIKVTEKRLSESIFTSPYHFSRVILLMQEQEKTGFANLEEIRKTSELTIGLIPGTAFQDLAKKLFPEAKFIEASSPELCFENRANAVLWTEEEAISWLMKHPSYTITSSALNLGILPISYALQSENFRFLNYLQGWLDLKQKQGYVEDLVEKWLYAKTLSKESLQKRWSILDNLILQKSEQP